MYVYSGLWDLYCTLNLSGGGGVMSTLKKILINKFNLGWHELFLNSR